MKVSILKQKNFSLLMCAKLVSLIGTQMQDFALSLYVLKITGSASKFASVIAVALIAQLVLGPFGGVFADWFDRKKIIVALDLFSGIIVGLFAFIFFISGELSLPSIYILSIALALISSLYQPAVITIIPTIIEKNDLADANGLNSIIMNVGNLISPLIAGILFGMMGLLLILLLNSISFIIAGLSEVFINIPKSIKKHDNISFGTFKTDFTEGIKFIKVHKLILTIIILAAFVNFLFVPFSSVGITYISKRVLKVTDFQYGLLATSLVIAMMIGPLFASSFTKRFKLGTILFWGILLDSIIVGIMSIVPTPQYLSLFKSNLIPYISIVLLFFIIGLISSIYNIAMSVMFQQTVPLDIMGRVATVMTTVCMACSPLGTILFGFLYDNISASSCLILTAIASTINILIFRKALMANYEEDANSKTNSVDFQISQ